MLRWLLEAWFSSAADGVQGWSCTRCWQALLPSGTGSRCWCCAWFWPESMTSHLQSGRTAQTQSKTWYFFKTWFICKGKMSVCHDSDTERSFCHQWITRSHFLLFFKISRMLVVDPKQRFTATDVLNHSFFSEYVVDEVRKFSPYRRFKVGFSF